MGEITALQEQLAETEGALATCLAGPPDADGDGVPDDEDACPATETGSEVDSAGCSHPQFCALIEIHRVPDIGRCFLADFRGDEPQRLFPRDCRLSGRGGLSCIPVNRP